MRSDTEMLPHKLCDTSTFDMEQRPKTLLSLIIPTYNERENVVPLLKRLFEALNNMPPGISAELIVVDDDSPDGTADLIASWLNAFGTVQAVGSEQLCRVSLPGRIQHPLVRIVRRSRKAGLASAVIEGMRRANGEVLGFMDADLSHPPSAIPSLVGAVVEPDGADLAIGSRYIPGSRTLGVPRWHKVGSRLANWLARPVSPVHDSTSGFMFFKRDIITTDDINTNRFHVGLEIIAKGRYDTYRELPYQFTARSAGRSKFQVADLCNLLFQLASLFFTIPRTKVGSNLERQRNFPTTDQREDYE